MTLAATVTGAALVAGLLVPGATGDERSELLRGLPASAWPDSITALDDQVSRLDPQLKQLDRRVVEVDRRLVEGEETVVALTSDVLFAFDRAELPPAAQTRIEELLADVPEGRALQVHGHTDSLAEDAYNQDLSERRARAVAEVVRAVRPDLELEVAGFGESDPVAPNQTAGQDDPEGRALNRRVELRYAG